MQAGTDLIGIYLQQAFIQQAQPVAGLPANAVQGDLSCRWDTFGKGGHQAFLLLELLANLGQDLQHDHIILNIHGANYGLLHMPFKPLLQLARGSASQFEQPLQFKQALFDKL
jgi:hypothetical protein